MINWSEMKSSGRGADADGHGRYWCYTTYARGIFTNRMLFQRTRYAECEPYIFECDNKVFLETICRCLWHPTLPKTVLEGEMRRDKVHQIINNIKRDGFSVIELSASIYQNKKKLLFHKFKKLNKPKKKVKHTQGYLWH